MTDEWDVKRVADLEVGDEVKGWGVLTDRHLPPAHLPDLYTVYFDDDPETSEHWPAHARVDVRRPVEITVEDGCYRAAVKYMPRRWWVRVDHRCVAEMESQDHAEEYAERLRGSADERRKALGQ